MIDPATSHARESWIVGHDGSDGASLAAAWTLAQAANRPVDITLLRTWDLPAVDFPLPMERVEDFVPNTELARTVADVTSAAPDGVTVSGSIVQGSPTNTLLDASDEASLLILGSRGLGGFRRLLLGSVGSQCATHASVPTVVVPSSTVPSPVRRVVVGFDGSERSEQAVRWIARWASEGTRVRVVGAWSPPTVGEASMAKHLAGQVDSAGDEFDSRLDRIEADTGCVPFDRRFASGDAARTLFAESEHADLLVVGQRGLTGFSAAVLGSVTTHMLHHSRIPVAVVPTSERSSE